MDKSIKYTVSLSFNEIKLPPFDDILVLGKHSPHGKNGISKSFELLIPNGFDVIEANHENVECVFINKRILSKMPADKILKILNDKVFPYITESEIIKVDFKVTISFNAIEEDPT